MGVGLTSALLAVSILLIASVIASKASRLGVPALLLFLIIGMLAGSDGPGGITFDYPAAAQSIGIVALALILFAGGLDTEWRAVRGVLGAGVTLATAGVLLTAGFTAAFASILLGTSLQYAFLLGAIVSSTDAAAVFAVLRSRNVALPANLRLLLELESGSNDPMAVFLTVAVITLIGNPEMRVPDLLPMFVQQMSIGTAVGYGMGRTMRLAVNRVSLDYDGLYPVLTLGLVLLTYGFADVIGGNGFLAVYLAGLTMRAGEFIHKRSLIRFHDGLAWLMQIAMFLTLGLQVFPTRLPAVAASGLAIAMFLMFVARPLAVQITTIPTGLGLRERLLVGWVGLRGAAPIVLATFPVVAGIPAAEQIFHLVFFIVVTSAVIQGTTVSWTARRLGLSSTPATGGGLDPLDLFASGDRDLVQVTVRRGSRAADRRLVDVQLPTGTLVVLVERQGASFVPTGSTVLLPDDQLLILVERPKVDALRAALEAAA
jgi:cell volume regulation protein A